MIEDRIQMLRQAAQSPDGHSVDKTWCVIAGNDKLVNDITYYAIASKKSIKIESREHVKIEENKLTKKFDFILLKGEYSKIQEICKVSKSRGSAYIIIPPRYIKEEPNLRIIIGPEDSVKKFVNETNYATLPISILLDDETSGFIEADLKTSKIMPKFIKNLIDPVFNVSEVVLHVILISVENDEDKSEIHEFAKKNNIFDIDCNDIMEE